MYGKILKFLSSVFFDAAVAVFSLAVSIWICDADFYGESLLSLYPFVIYPALMLLFSYVIKVYNTLWKYARYIDYVKIFIAGGAATFTMYALQSAVSHETYKLPVYIVACAFLCLIVYASRNLLQLFLIRGADSNYESDLNGNIMIIGGGEAGNEIISDIKSNNKKRTCRVRCVIDDDPQKKGAFINGVAVIGGKDEIIKAVKKYSIDIIVFAIPSCPGDKKAEFLRICQQTGCKLKIIPSLFKSLIDDKPINATTIRNVEIEDLLGRESININLEMVMGYVNNKVVMVTGGGGSIGSELCRQISNYNPKQLIIFDVYENNAYNIQNELKRKHPELDLIVLIGSVRDSKRLDCVFSKYKPQIVYHAAAHKHVPLMEESPNETLKNNVFGTLKTVECANRHGTEKFVLISTDKAVNPTNIMGASKRICEMIIQSYNRRSKTEFVAVRFGNVLGSNGSVIPLFKEQIANGGPVTVTDPNIIRYFMTIPEAVSLVLQAGATAKGGEIFVLDMGKPVRILDLAENLIKLSGFTPYADIKIEFTGLRPGEKLYEEILMDEEGLVQTDNKLIYIGRPINFDENAFWQSIDRMRTVMYDDSVDARAIVKEIVDTYRY